MRSTTRRTLALQTRRLAVAVAAILVTSSALLVSPSGAFNGSAPPVPGSAEGYFVSTLGSGFNEPSDIALDRSGHIFVANFTSGRVVMMNLNGSHAHGVGSGFVNPYGVAIDAQNRLFVTDNNAGTVTVLSPSGAFAQRVIATGLNAPIGIAVDNRGHLFVANRASSTVVRMNIDGSNQVTIGTGFQNPFRLNVDRAGHVFVADTNHSRIVEMNEDGSNEVVVGYGFFRPEGASLDASGNIAIGDYSNNRVAMIQPDGNVVTILSGAGGPEGVYLSASGTVYVAPTDNTKLTVLRPDPNAQRLNNAALVSWSEHVLDGFGATYFTVTAHPDSGPALSAVFGGTARSGTIYGLTNGVQYTFTVSATNQYGTSGESSSTPAVVPGPSLAGVMGAPQVHAANHSLSVKWTAPSNGGSPVTGYLVTATDPFLTQVTATFSPASLSGTINGLGDAKRYSVTVQAINAVGVADRSLASTAVPIGPPSFPFGDAMHTVPGLKKVTISWLGATANGVPITGYKVTASPGAKSCSTKALSCSIVGLTSAKSYSLSVVATSSLGNSNALHAVAKPK